MAHKCNSWAGPDAVYAVSPLCRVSPAVACALNLQWNLEHMGCVNEVEEPRF